MAADDSGWSFADDAPAAPTSPGYLNDDEFALSMDSTFGQGNWSQTGGWRSQQRENALRQQGAQTVAPGHTSAHSQGDDAQPGARDITVQGLTPAQAAAKLQAVNFPGSYLPEGAAGTQGAHLHIGMSGTPDQGWSFADDGGGQAAGGWSFADQPAPKKGGTGGILDAVERGGASVIGGAVKGFGDLLHSFGVVGDAAGQAAAKQGADTGYVVVGSDIIKLTPAQQAQAKQQVATNAPTASPQIEPTAQKFQTLGEKIAPQNRSGLESVLHGAGEMSPALGSAMVNPALGATVFGVQGYASAHDEAVAKGASRDAVDRAALENAGVQGVLGMVPVGHVADALAQGVANPLLRFGARYLYGSAADAALMTGVQTGSNVVARQNYDPDRPWFQQVPEAMAQGAAGGVLLRAGHDVAAGATNAATGRLRPRETPVTQPGNPAVTDVMPETDAIRAYSGQRPSGGPDEPPGAPPGAVVNPNAEGPALGPDGVPLSAGGQTISTPGGTRTGGRRGPNAGVETLIPGAPDIGTPVLANTAAGLVHGTVTDVTPDGQPVIQTAVGPVAVDPAKVTALPLDYEAQRVAHGAPLEQMPQAIADVGEYQRAAPKGYSLFQAMKDLGGIRTKALDGSPESDVQQVLDGVRRPGLINNKTGLSPDAMRAALQERGWFGEFDQSQGAEDFGQAKPGDDVNELYELMRREASGEKVLHPSDENAAVLGRRTDLDDQMRQAGVGVKDPRDVAAAKLAAWRGEQVRNTGPEMEALRQEAHDLGMDERPGAPYDALLADVVEHASRQPDYDGWAGDRHEGLIDAVLTPEEHEWLTAAGRSPEGEPEPAFPAPVAGREAGTVPGAEEGAGEPRAGAGGGGEGAAGLHQPDQLTREQKRAKFEALVAETKAKKARSDALAEQGRAMKFEAPDGRRVLVSPDLDEPGKWRVTYFDKTGDPTGHTVSRDAKEAFWDVMAGDQFKPVGAAPPEPPGSWVVVDRATGKPVLETFKREVADKVDREKFEVLRARDWLERYNRAVKENGGVEPTALASEKVKLAGETADQLLIPGAERSAQQAAAAREGPLKAKGPQQDAGGLFAPPEPDQSEIKFARAERPEITARPEFKRWFGDSQVVDGNGKPKIVYHGTNVHPEARGENERPLGDIDQFDRLAAFKAFARREGMDAVGSWFSEHPGTGREHEAAPAGAGMYAGAEGGAIYPVYLRIEKPWMPKDFNEFLDKMHEVAGRDPKTQRPRGLGSVGELRDWLKSEGHDGILFSAGEIDHQRAGEVWVALEPEQIKSAMNGGAFDPNDPRISFAKAPPFYSAVERHVQNLALKSASPEQWKATLSNAPGVKREELEWTGINDWLDLFPKGEKVPKDKVEAFLRDNGVKVEEKTLGQTADNVRPDEQAMAEHGEAWNDIVEQIRHHTAAADEKARAEGYDAAQPHRNALFDLAGRQADLHDKMVNETMARGNMSGEPAKFSDWTLPGGSDYRELLFTLPKEANPPATHWDTPGVLAHVRFDTRTAPDGKKVLFLQELQSDWMQNGRDQGFAKKASPEEVKAAQTRVNEADAHYANVGSKLISAVDELLESRIPKLEALRDEMRNREQASIEKLIAIQPLHGPEYQAAKSESVGLTRAADAAADNVNRAKNALNTIRNSGRTVGERAATAASVAGDSVIWGPGEAAQLVGMRDDVRSAALRTSEARQGLEVASGKHGIPNAPFKSSWPALIMKRMIRWAADHGYDRVAWTTGEQQLERYPIEKHVGRLTLHDNSSGGIGRPQMDGPFNGGHLIVHDPHGRQILDRPIYDYNSGSDRSPETARKNLAEVIGQTLADRLLAQEPREARTAGIGVRERHLEGLDVKIGGDGMRQFYDRNLVNITNDLIKKYGGKVGPTEVDGIKDLNRHFDIQEVGGGWQLIDLDTGKPIADAPLFRNGRQAEDWLDTNKRRSAAQPGFDITPKMAEAATGGFPLFKRREAPSDIPQPKGVSVGAAVPGDREASAFADKVEKAIRRVAPFVEVVPARHITERSTGAKALGVSWRDGLRHIIAWAVDSPDAIGIGRHEAVHALRNGGVIRPEEWETLEEAATNEDWKSRYNIDRRYPELAHDKQIEEAVAERFREWRRDGEKGLRGLIQTVFQRIAKVMDVVKDLAKRTFGGKATAADIFSRMESGEMGARMGKEYNPPPRPDPNSIPEPAMARRPVNPVAAARAQREAEAQREIDEREGRTPEAKKTYSAINDILGQGIDSSAQKVWSAASKALPDPVTEGLEDAGHAVNLALNPMAAGSPRAQAAAKDFANALRLADNAHERLDKWLNKTFTPEQQRTMWEAADEHGVILRRGEEPGPGQGLNRLTPEEQTAVLELQRRADQAFDEASALGMVKGDGLESYVPRMIVQMTAFGPKVLERSTPRQAGKGGNLSTTTGQLRQRKYETTGETEAAAQGAFGEKATVVRNIRTLPLATQRLDRAIAGRTLVNRIKELSSQTGEPLVVESDTQPPDQYFTLDHPAMQVWRPKFVTDPESGKLTAAVDQNGDVVFEPHPLWVSKEFEGPLSAVLSTPPGAIDRAIIRPLMEIKAKMMGVIMYSPLMHNAVIWGRALAADPLGVATLEAYRRGFRAKSDPATMAEAIRAGLAPISRHFDKIDTASIANSGAEFMPGRSWTSQALGFVPGLFDKNAGDAVKQKVDEFGDLWHNTFLWDRVGDLQMGLYTKIRDDLIRKGNKFGIDAQTAQRIAAHYANRYAGSLPTEGMSKIARSLANMLMFSRSFTLGNLAAFKDVTNGLPSDVRGQILRDRGVAELQRAQGVARRKAIVMLGLDAAFAFAGLWLAAGAVAWLTGQHFQAPPQNEDKYKNRFLLRYQSDGTAVYGRLPTGKTVEDQWHWLTQPVTTFKQKMSPFAKTVDEIVSNDLGFGRKLYDPYGHTAGDFGKNILRVVGHVFSSIAPMGQAKGVHDLITGQGDRKTAALQTLLPTLGITVSKGAPGGPAVGDLYAAKDEHEFQVQQAMPAIQQQIKAGDILGARQKMQALGIAPGLQNYYVKVTRNPGLRLSGRQMRDFLGYASPEQRAQLQRDRAARAAAATGEE